MDVNAGTATGKLVEPREDTYFAIAAVFSAIGWLFCVLTLSPICMVIFLVFFAWLANGLLVAQLKADAIKVDERQLPALSQALARVCARLGVTTIPELYIVQAGGHLNAFATRHSGRHFVVVFSDMLEAYGADSPEIEFVLGHEIGHIRRNHLLKQILLMPGMLVPLLGNAYSRACEMSCDRHGFFASSSPEGAVNAMLILAGGKHARGTMSPAAFATQYEKERGFFVSWYELISGYPTLSHRVANLIALGQGRETPRLGRNPLAYVFALFTMGGRGTGGANILVTVAVVGLLAAIAIPSFMKAREKAQQNTCAANLRVLDAVKAQAKIEYHLKDTDEPTEKQLSALHPGIANMHCAQGGEYSIGTLEEEAQCSVHGTLSDLATPRTLPSRGPE